MEDAAKAWRRFSAVLAEAQVAYRDDVLGSVRAASWEGAAADAAVRQMTPLGQRVQVASTQAGSVASVLDAGARELRAAQKELTDAIRDADGIHLRVGDDGSLTLPEMSPADRRDPESIRYWASLRQQAEQIEARFQAAMRNAEESDRRLSEELTNLGADGDYATALATQLAGFSEHPVNLPPELIAYARQAARKYGISDTLMLMILWQEQQWYQNYGSGNGPIGALGRWFDRTVQDIKGDKSMGVTHMKPDTAREVLARDGARDEHGRLYSTYSDDELAANLEDDPRFAIDTTARYLSQIKSEPDHWSDKQTFLTYAADNEEMREANRRAGDSTDARGFAIRDRAENWDRVAPKIEAEQAWERLSPDDRQRALGAMGSPGSQVVLNLPYTPAAGVDVAAEGTRPPVPGQPSPGPNPSPTPGGG
ncbi:MAG TPA: hypothetical protein VF069_02035 [Streptosporangiaceae bacterium]